MCDLLRVKWSANSTAMYLEDKEAFTRVLHIVASSLEFLYGHVGILWEEYNIPVVVSHSRRLVLLFVQYASKQVAAAWLQRW
jgi:hypothetical protein